MTNLEPAFPFSRIFFLLLFAKINLVKSCCNVEINFSVGYKINYIQTTFNLALPAGGFFLRMLYAQKNPQKKLFYLLVYQNK